MLVRLLVQVLLIAINALFAATEIAVISLNEVKLRRQSEGGDKKAKKMLKMVEEPTGFLSTIQVGITLAGFLGSAFAAEGFSDPFVHFLVDTCGITFISRGVLDAISVILITLLLSFFTLVFGELVPKRIAMRNAEKLARGVSGFITGLSRVMKPVVWLLSVSTNGILRLFGINPNETAEEVSQEDILDMVDAVEEQGEIDTETREMIENVFEFDNITVNDIMVRRSDMTLIGRDDSQEKIIQTIVESGFSRFPVYGEREDDIVGILRAREYLLAVREGGSCKPEEVMHTPRFVPDSLSASVLFRNMQREKNHMVIAVDEYGQTAGLVTMEDLIEEVMGNIYDETDAPEEPNIQPLEEGKWKIQGNTPLEEVQEELRFLFDEEEAEAHETFGGFIVGQLEYIPNEGETPELDYRRLHIRVTEVADKRIEWTEVTVSEEEPQTEDEESDERED